MIERMPCRSTHREAWSPRKAIPAMRDENFLAGYRPQLRKELFPNRSFLLRHMGRIRLSEGRAKRREVHPLGLQQVQAYCAGRSPSLRLHQAIHLNHLPGIFPVAKSLHLGQEWPRYIYATMRQCLHPFGRGEGAIFFAERIDGGQNHLCLVRRQIFEDRARGVKHAHAIGIKVLFDIGLGVWIGIGHIDMTHPEGWPHPREEGCQRSELKVMHEVDIGLVVLCISSDTSTTLSYLVGITRGRLRRIMRSATQGNRRSPAMSGR